MKDGWYQIIAPHATAGIAIKDDKVVETAPIFRKLFMGRPADWVKAYVDNAGWEMIRAAKQTAIKDEEN